MENCAKSSMLLPAVWCLLLEQILGKISADKKIDEYYNNY